MASPVDVVNESLIMLGQQPISGFDEGSVNGNRANAVYFSAVDATLRAGRPQCARYFAVLAEVSTPPAFKWAHQFFLPNGTTDPYCLRVWEVNDCASTVWQLGGGRVLLTNEATAKIEYTGRLDDPTQWDALLYQAVVTMVASKLAIPLRHDAKEAQSLYALAMSMAADAQMVNAQEQSMEVFETNDLVDVRG